MLKYESKCINNALKIVCVTIITRCGFSTCGMAYRSTIFIKYAIKNNEANEFKCMLVQENLELTKTMLHPWSNTIPMYMLVTFVAFKLIILFKLKGL